MKKHCFLLLVLLAAVMLLCACHSDTDPWQPLPSSAPITSAPTATVCEEEQAAEEINDPDPEPTPGGDPAPGLNG